MNYGFLINNDTCIGCHACSTACKSENGVPLGIQRTWVKSVETGSYPDVRRNFQVTRCNHCARPPCVRICPVTAMYQREDGIVEFDADECIGCKACMQACPYDAIYIDPESKTAAKCHYCAHRVDIGLEPACVVVCPEHAILAGDIDDPQTEIARTIAQNEVTTRKPEKETDPKLYYVGGDSAAMHPAATDRTTPAFAWVDVLPVSPAAERVDVLPVSPAAERGDGQARGAPVLAEQMVQVVYNAQHKVPWHWPVPAYLVTKGIGAGLFMILSLGAGLGFVYFDPVSFLTFGLLSLLFMGITTALLVVDLERPERFLRILTRPQWKSWLVRGAYLLIGFWAIAGLWWIAEFAAWMEWIDLPGVEAARPILLWIGFPLALGSTVYTAFLFGQTEGRELWQGKLLHFHLVVQAFLAGSAVILVTSAVAESAVVEVSAELVGLSRAIFGWTLALDLLVTLMGEFAIPHATETAARAAREITHGRHARTFWIWGIFAGRLVPLALLLLSGTWMGVLGGILALVGLYAYEHVFVMAPQELPNS